ncbi:hypothetical protein HK413_00940 [Mucilaginibacter sp. S1162]|uniref:Uncharacterized protein n=1 Tax=Mucilaginibacter humi TaxID=2732510 RepID=A0ABX1VZQ0_9SPHI|nr:hypothetical protein [Mucilaginibacter humi]NNU33104.1 hypothetical protein [Mucilaginibacter humi]
MDFAPGRFYFNIFPEISDKKHTQFKIALKYLITKQIVSEFKITEANDDNILTFVIHLQHAIIRAFCNNSHVAWLHLGNIGNMHMVKLKAEEQDQIKKVLLRL